jgi:hypothetical protein
MRPKVLLLMTCCWVPPARFALVLLREGCDVDAVCPPSHVIRKVKGVGHAYTYNGFQSSLRNAILESRPDFIIPCDDYGTSNLYKIWQEESSHGDPQKLAALIARSLGNPDNCHLVTERGRFLDVAKHLGILIPKTDTLPSATDVKNWLRSQSFPAYVKADGTSGGVGVRRVENAEAAQQAALDLARPPGMLRTFKRFVVDQDRRLLMPFLKRVHPSLSLQEFIEGNEANAALACWQGELIGCICFEVIERTEALGPAAVLRVIRHPQMEEAAAKLVSHLQLTGLYGLDFILSSTGDAYLLEMNARATQTCHLVLGDGRSPIPALAARLAGHDTPAITVTELNTIALFPAEWIRDPQSTYLDNAYHDVPWESPELIDASLTPNLEQRLRFGQGSRVQAFRASVQPPSRKN